MISYLDTSTYYGTNGIDLAISSCVQLSVYRFNGTANIMSYILGIREFALFQYIYMLSFRLCFCMWLVVGPNIIFDPIFPFYD